MQAIIILIAIFLAGFLFMCNTGKNSTNGNTETETNNNEITVADPENLSKPDDTIRKAQDRQELIKKLNELRNKPAPTDLQMGAMCYAPRRLTNRYEYICPKCGEKTIHAFNYADSWNKEITVSRNVMKMLPANQFQLDESSFCKKCNPNATTPELCLYVKYSKEKVVKTCGVTADDIKIIHEFISGKTKHKTANDSEVPLKNHAERIAELLGLTE